MSRVWRHQVVRALLARLLLPTILLLEISACESASRRDDAGVSPPGYSAYGAFSGQAAWGHLESLTRIGPRVSGSRGSERARAYLRAELAAIGIEVDEYRLDLAPSTSFAPFAPFDLAGKPDSRQIELVHLVGVIPGQSDDVFLLAAHYDTAEFDSFRFVGANSGASGPALLLEVARNLASRPQPYTVWLAFLDGDALAPSTAEPARFVGSELLAKRWADDGVLKRLRLAVFFDRVADADLNIARDLRSHSVYRDLFWDAARRLGYQHEFALDRGFESPVSGHRAFLDQRFLRVVALVDNRYGGGDPPGNYWRSEDDVLEHCSAESLNTVGSVTLEALGEIGRRLEKIDRFTRSPY